MLEALSYLNDIRIIDEDLAVQVSQNFPNEDSVCEVLPFIVIEKVDELLVVVFKQTESQPVLQFRR